MERCDLLIVGGGPAGVGTAYRLRHSGLHVKVLEAGGEVGGRTKSVDMPGGAANTGAQFVYRGTPSEELVTELGLATIPFEPTTYGVTLDGHTVVGSSNTAVVDGLPLTVDERRSLLTFLDEAVEEYHRSTTHGVFTAAAERLADRTVAERLQELPPRVREIVETAVRGGAVGDTDQLSAQYALRYFASYPAHEKENRLLVDAGMQALTTTMAAALSPDVVQVSTAVTSIEHRADDDLYLVRATTPRGDVVYRATQVVLAVPAPLVAGLVSKLPTWKTTALEKAATPGSTTVVVAVDLRGVEEYREWAFVTTVGTRFDCIINPTPGRWRSPQEPGIAHFVCYGNDPGYQPDLPGNPEAEATWIEDFLTVAPALRGRIRGYHVQTWEHCFALLSPARAAVVERLRAPVGRLHFAGDWTSPSAGTHGALGEASRVAGAVLAARGRADSGARSREPVRG